MTIERTGTWALALLMAGGCTSNVISLDSEDGGDTEGDTGMETFPGTSTTPPADSGSDDGLPECDNDWDCGDCGWCLDGVCQEDFGCCSVVDPEQPAVWRCSPPWECWDDSECGDDQICVDGWCEPDPNPQIQIQQPPTCLDELALLVDELALDAAYDQVAVAQGKLWVLGGELRPVSFETGVGDPVGEPPPGEVLRELLAIDASTLVAVTTGLRGTEHQLSRIQDPGDGSWIVSSTALQPGGARASTWLSTPGEVLVATEGQLTRWDIDLQPLASIPQLFGGDPAALAPVPLGDGSRLLGVARTDGAVELWDTGTEALAVDGHALLGSPVDMAHALDTGGGEPRLFAVSHVVVEPEPGIFDDYAAIELVRIDDPLSGTAPFGAPGVPQALATTDLDGDGIYDVLVANADGRLDVYLMDAAGPRCRSFLPLSLIIDLEAGDIDGDGLHDVLVIDEGPAGSTLWGIHGAG